MKYLKTCVVICLCFLLSALEIELRSAEIQAATEFFHSLPDARDGYAKLSISSTSLTTAETFRVVLEVQSSERLRSPKPHFPPRFFSDFTIVDEPLYSETAVIVDGELHWRKAIAYILSPNNAGKFVLPGLRIPFTSASDISNTVTEERVIVIEPIEIRVSTVLESSTDRPRELRGEILPTHSLVPYVFAIPAAIATLWISFLVASHVSKHSRERHKTPQEYKDEALDRLRQLREKDYLKHGKAEQFHTALSSILRRYLEKALGFKAEASTTEEFIAEAARSDLFDDRQKAMLGDFLSLADQVKFGKYRPGDQANENSLRCVTLIVEYQTSEQG